MTHRRATTCTTTALAILAGAVMPIAAAAQGTGPVFTIGLSTGLFHETSPGDPDETFFGTRLDLGLVTETRNQRFSFSVGALSEISDSAPETFDLTNPSAALGYALFNRNNELAVDLAWRETDVGDGDLLDEFDGEDLIDDDGTREIHQADLSLVTGRTGRFSTDTRLGYREVNYHDVTDPDLIDERRHSASTEFTFVLDPRITARSSVSWSQTDEDDLVNTTTTRTRFGIGADFLVDRVWSASLDLGVSGIETEIDDGFGGRVSSDQDGYDITGRVTRDMANGDLSLVARRDVLDGEATVHSLQVSRMMDLANGAAFSAMAGVVLFDGDDAQPLVGLSYDQEILRGHTVSVSLEQSAGRNDDDTGVVRTRLSAAYRQDLTRNSSWAVTGNLADIDVTGGSAADTRRASIGLSYSHDLTRDWALVARADHRRVYEAGVRTDRTNTLSLNLERTFSFRP